MTIIYPINNGKVCAGLDGKWQPVEEVIQKLKARHGEHVVTQTRATLSIQLSRNEIESLLREGSPGALKQNGSDPELQGFPRWYGDDSGWMWQVDDEKSVHVYSPQRGEWKSPLVSHWGTEDELLHAVEQRPDIFPGFRTIAEPQHHPSVTGQTGMANLQEQNRKLISDNAKLRTEVEELTKQVSGVPDACPFSGRDFFMWIGDPNDDTKMLPTYGGPFDSYTIPERDDDGSFSRMRYDHDYGGWRESESIGMSLVKEIVPYELEEAKKELEEAKKVAEEGGKLILNIASLVSPRGELIHRDEVLAAVRALVEAKAS